MKKIKNYSLTTKRWIPGGIHLLHFPEDIYREIDASICKGRWWEWLPIWAHPLKIFSDEVATVAEICRVNKESLARRLIESSRQLIDDPFFKELNHLSAPVSSWEIAQAIESWIFYELRQCLVHIMKMELDGMID